MNIDGRDLTELTPKRAHVVFDKLLDAVEGDPSLVLKVAFRMGQFPARAFPDFDEFEIIEQILYRANVSDQRHDKMAKKARAAFGEGRASLLYSIVDPDEISRQADVDAEAYKIGVREEARRTVDDEKRGDLPSLPSLVMDWDALLAQPAPRWTVDGVIPEGGTALLYGVSGLGKTFAAASIAASIAGGFDWLGRPVQGGSVLVIMSEGAAGAGKRLRALSDAWNGGEPIEALRVLPVAPNLTSETDIGELESLNREHDFAVIVYDTLNRVAGDAEENSATAMSGILNAIERIRRAGTRTTSLIVHHSGKNGEMRGSTALWAAADTVLELTGEPSYLKLEARKQKDAPEGVVGFFRLAPWPRHDTLILEGVAPGQGQPSGAQAARVEESLAHFVRAFGETGATVTQFVDVLIDAGVAKKTAAHEYVTELIRSGRLKKTTAGRGSRLELATAPITFDPATNQQIKEN